MFTDPIKTASGLFVVDWLTNYPAWRAWREWQHEAFGKKFFPQKLTVPFAWPPETSEGAQSFCDWLEAIRKSIESDDRKHGGGPCKALPEIVLPWRGWAPDLLADVTACEVLRRKQWDGLFDHAPRYVARHRMGFRHPAPIDNERAKAEAHKLAAE